MVSLIKREMCAAMGEKGSCGGVGEGAGEEKRGSIAAPLCLNTC